MTGVKNTFSILFLCYFRDIMCCLVQHNFIIKNATWNVPFLNENLMDFTMQVRHFFDYQILWIKNSKNKNRIKIWLNLQALNFNSYFFHLSSNTVAEDPVIYFRCHDMWPCFCILCVPLSSFLVKSKNRLWNSTALN